MRNQRIVENKGTWKNHLNGWAKYTAAAGAALSMATGADAGIVSSNPNVTVNLANLNSVPNGTHASAGFGLTGAVAAVGEQTFFNGASGDRRGGAYIAGINILGVHVNNGGLADNGNHEAAFNFAAGQAIGGSHLGNFATLWRATTRSGRRPFGHVGNFVLGASGLGATGIVGFTINSGDLGWIKVQIGDRNSDGYVDQLKIISWAYNQTPGAAIKAGDSTDPAGSATPEPSTAALGVLAAGAAGIVALRQRRKEVQPN